MFYQTEQKNVHLYVLDTEGATGGILEQKVFLEISQILRKTPVVESLF